MKRTEYWNRRFGSLRHGLSTAKRLSHKAQGWSGATTLGSLEPKSRNPDGVAPNVNGLRIHGSRQAATLGFGSKPLRGLSAMILTLALAAFTFAQSASTISGRITDQHGANVAGAELQLRSRTGVRLFAVTNEDGAYSFRAVPTGDYALEVSAKGFATHTSRFHVANPFTNDLVLPVESVRESVVVTAAGTAQRIDEVSKSVSVLDDQSIEARRELTLAESLRGTPGIRIQQQGSIGALTTVRLRRLRNFDTAILLDGLRVRDASDINGSAVVVIPDLLPADLDRVEVLRGSGSSIYGTNAIGGVINLVPRTGTGQSHFEFGFDGGGLAPFLERLRGAGGNWRGPGSSFCLSRLDVRRGVDGNDEYGNTVGVGRFQINVTPTVMISANFYGTIANGRINDSPFALPAAFSGA